MFKASPLFKANLNSTSDVIVNQGGTSSGKTYSILQVLFVKAAQQPKIVITICGQDIPNLKAGALRDALAIYSDSEKLQRHIVNYNKSDRIFEFRNGSIIEFKSYDGPQDAKSGKRDYLFVNEANGIPHSVYTELALRTRKQIYIDYNPNAEFWVHTELIGQPGVQLLISDHRHNPFLEQSIRTRIEALKFQDEDLWKVYARGLTGKIEGLIFRNWTVIDELPKDEQGKLIPRYIASGMDFGFTNDPTTLLDVYMMDQELYLDERLHETGLTNPDICRKLSDMNFDKGRMIIADSSEPKSIKEIRNEGWRIDGADKGPDSIRLSIDILKRFRLNVTRTSTNLRKELNNYKWKVAKDGTTINEPIDAFNHLIDPLRYVAQKKLSNVNKPLYHIVNT